MTAENEVAVWQRSLDETFPNGVKVTVVDDVPEETESSAVFLAPSLTVIHVLPENIPVVRVLPPGVDKDVLFTIKSHDTNWHQGSWLITQEKDGQPRIILDTNFSAETMEQLKKVKEGAQ